MKIDQNVEIWFERGGIDQYIWGQSWELIKMLKFDLKEEELISIFEDKVGNWSKCWNFSANCQADQNVQSWVKRGDWLKCWNWVKMGEFKKMLKFLRQSWKSIKMLTIGC